MGGLPAPKLLEKANRDPLNQAALPWLRKTGQSVSPDSNLYLLDLALWGQEQGIEVGGLDRGVQQTYLGLALGQMLSWDPENWLRWLTTNPEGDEPENQRADLLAWLDNADSPEEAALRTLEAIVDRLKAENPNYRQAATSP